MIYLLSLIENCLINFNIFIVLITHKIHIKLKIRSWVP